MIKKIINTILVVLIFIGLMSLGGYTISEVKHAAQIKSPKDVFAPIISMLPELPSTDSATTENINSTDNVFITTESTTTDDLFITTESNTTENELENLFTTEDNQNNKITISSKRTIKVTINGKSIELTSENTISFIKWLSNNYNSKAKVTCEETTPPEVLEEIKQQEEQSTTEKTTESTDELIYNNVLSNEKELDIIVDSINVVKSLENIDDLDDYDRTAYEKPSQSYKLNGTKYNRNDYAWKSSKWFDEESFTYICPYTGTTVYDIDDEKEDSDFGTLDFDHIVPLKSTYLRGAYKWTDKQKNEYAYDQWIGVDVLYSANRSKSDKGPADWLPTENVEDYCYSWLLICSKYNLSMTKEEIDICIDNINIALDNGETIEHLGGVYQN